MNYKKAIEEIQTEYENKLFGLAEQAKQEILIPYLIKNGYHFLTGNGTFYIYDRSNHMIDNLPKKVRDILELEINNYGNPCLGLWMTNYTNE